LYDPLHPAVLHLVAHVIRTANKLGIPVSVCGEMAGEPELTRVLLGMGLRSFSMHPNHLPMVKQVVLKTSVKALETLTKRLLSAYLPDKIHGILTKLNA
jgi:phosphotransferase system enzyme I (PtsI)